MACAPKPVEKFASSYKNSSGQITAQLQGVCGLDWSPAELVSPSPWTEAASSELTRLLGNSGGVQRIRCGRLRRRWQSIWQILLEFCYRFTWRLLQPLPEALQHTLPAALRCPGTVSAEGKGRAKQQGIAALVGSGRKRVTRELYSISSRRY